MAGFHNEEEEIISGINVTPLVDIMLVLLIIFMLISSFVNISAIEVDLPHAASASEAKSLSVSILISKDGNYYVAGKKTTGLEDVKSILKLKKREAKEIQTIISADNKVRHEKVVELIDMIRELKIYKFAINVEYQGN